jgi:hypothetical protein
MRLELHFGERSFLRACIWIHPAHRKSNIFCERMITSKEKYSNMCNVVRKILQEHRSVTPWDAIALSVSFDALSSLFGQIYVRQLRADLRNFTNPVKQEIVRRVQQGESLLAISKEYQLGTYKFAILYLHEALGREVQLTSLLYKPEQIEDARIRSELLQMIAADTSSAPDVDLLKEASGKEYEELLIDLLNKRNMCFETEVELRSKGKPKTPDILFSIPMAVALSELEQSRSADHSNYAVINWIDSKAMFADKITLEEQIDQFRAYNNRHGRGMVIYWHGFAEEILVRLPDDMVLFRASFPERWLFPTGEPADGRVPEFDRIEPS